MAKKPSVCLDAGHYGKYNAGAVSGYWESEIVWKLTQYEAEELRKRGIDVVLTRKTIDEAPEVLDPRDGLWHRGYMAAGCDYFESNHTNAAGSSAPDYVVVIPQSGRPKAYEAALKMGRAVAECMGVTLSIYTKLADDGTEWYAVDRGAKAADVDGWITEHGFHTNPKICKWLMDDDNLRMLARVKAETWCDIFGLPRSVEATKKPTGHDKAIVGTWVNKKTRYVWNGAGTSNKKLVKLPVGTKCHCYGYFRHSKLKKKWPYVVATVNGIEYTGFISTTGFLHNA